VNSLARVNVCVETVEARTGRVLARTWRHNLVVDAGLNLLRDRLAGNASAELTHGAVGTDGTAAAAANVALGAEVFRDQLSTKTLQSKALQIKFVVGSSAANGATLREAGLFNAEAGGTLFARVTPEPVVKSADILVIYTWTVSLEAAA
jgi:hypothetical protein